MSELDTRCSTVAELASHYVEGALSPAQQTSYETHLVYCDACVAFLDDIRDVVQRLHELPPDEVVDAERDAILASSR